MIICNNEFSVDNTVEDCFDGFHVSIEDSDGCIGYCSNLTVRSVENSIQDFLEDSQESVFWYVSCFIQQLFLIAFFFQVEPCWKRALRFVITFYYFVGYIYNFSI